MKLDAYELEVLHAYESGELIPSATRAELERMQHAARATAIKDQRINIRLSSNDLRDIKPRRCKNDSPTKP